MNDLLLFDVPMSGTVSAVRLGRNFDPRIEEFAGVRRFDLYAANQPSLAA